MCLFWKFEKIVVGSIVTSTDNLYGKFLICEVDRVYKRNDTKYCRLVFLLGNETKKVNVKLKTCKIVHHNYEDHLGI